MATRVKENWVQRYGREISVPALGRAVAVARGRVFLLLLIAAFALLSTLTSTALAVQSHALKFSFDGTGGSAGPFQDLGGLAIYQPDGTVYAIDRLQGTIDKFDAAGNPQNFSALGSSSLDVEASCPDFQFPPGPGGPYAGYYHGRDGIAVSSSGPTNGNIYVATDSRDPGAPEGVTPEVCAFNSSGEFLWRETEHPGTGLFIDPTGRLWIAAYEPGILILENTGSPPELESLIPAGGAEYLAVDSEEHIFVAFNSGDVNRYSFLGSQEQVQPGPSRALALDLTTDRLYVTIGGAFREYNAFRDYQAGTAPRINSEAGEDIIGAAEGIAVRESTGDVYVSDSADGHVKVFGPVETFPTVTTGSAVAIRRTTAKATGTVDPAAGGPVIGCHVEFGIDKAYGNSAPCAEATPYSSPTQVTADMTGLVGGGTYHFRIFATNAAGTSKGEDLTFTTPFISDLSTESASNVERISATLNGSLDPDGVNTTYYFQWGRSAGYGNTAPIPPPGESLGSTPGKVSLHADIGGLETNTVYHYRLVGVNAGGMTKGADMSFKTNHAIKDLTTESPTEVGPDSAVLNGSLDPDGYDTHYYFEWGRTTSYGQLSPAPPGIDAGSTPGSTTVSATVSGLDDYTIYHYRLVAFNSFGTTIGQDGEFLSAPPFLPSISDTTTTSVTETAASVSAMINPGFGPTVYRFQYGTDTSYGSRTALTGPIGDDGNPHLATATIENLQLGTTYHYRAVGINFSGSTLGPDRTFVTVAPPGIDAISASDITTSTVKLHAQINPNASPTTYHFDYGTGVGYGSQTQESSSIGSATANQGVTQDLTGLAPETIYHYRVVATNRAGTVSSGDGTFKTAPPQVGGPQEQIRCKHGFSKRRGKCVRQRRKHRKGRHHTHRGDT